MVDYKTMYEIMLTASEEAIEKIEAQNYGDAKKTLIAAEQSAEDVYITGE